ncbi:MAG: hypothetical protein QOE22_86 [Candidatus Parcubacteria bacterium]|jgi:8-oxo-dGTP pyrophosphatase MutT (NUDIX family)|nr:hypothetical protein [Candidatus Parcubacteria bacterium]
MEIPPGTPEFGIRRENEERRDGGCGVVFDPGSQKYAVGRRDADGHLLLFSGGVDTDEDPQAGILREVTEESGLYDFIYVEKVADALTHYHNVLKGVNRVAYATCYLAILGSSKQLPLKLEEHEKFSLCWKTADEILKSWEENNEDKSYDHWIYFFKKAVDRVAALDYGVSKGG